jgi:hypothetical protein
MDEAYELSLKHFSRIRAKYNENVQERKFEVGQAVLVRYRSQSSAAHRWSSKLCQRWEFGIVKEVLDSVDYLISFPDGSERKVTVADIKGIYDLEELDGDTTSQ